MKRTGTQTLDVFHRLHLLLIVEEFFGNAVGCCRINMHDSLLLGQGIVADTSTFVDFGP